MSYEITLEDELDDYGDLERQVLVITIDGEVKARRYDGGEHEDNYYRRDWKWVERALLEAYHKGLEDGAK